MSKEKDPLRANIHLSVIARAREINMTPAMKALFFSSGFIKEGRISLIKKEMEDGVPYARAEEHKSLSATHPEIFRRYSGLYIKILASYLGMSAESVSEAVGSEEGQGLLGYVYQMWAGHWISPEARNPAAGRKYDA